MSNSSVFHTSTLIPWFETGCRDGVGVGVLLPGSTPDPEDTVPPADEDLLDPVAEPDAVADRDECDAAVDAGKLNVAVDVGELNIAVDVGELDPLVEVPRLDPVGDKLVDLGELPGVV